jgi:hypothetical protein
MPDIRSVFSTRLLLGALPFLLLGCTSTPTPPAIDVQLEQQWVLQPGDKVAGRRIQGGLGDISIELEGASVYAPYDGKVRPSQGDTACVFYATPQLPAYLFRWCGLEQPQLGAVHQGDAIAVGNTLEFAALRKQPSGRWAMVEPSIEILERTLGGQ